MIFGVVRNILIGFFLFILYIIDMDKKNLGVNAKLLIVLSASLKLGVGVPAYIITYLLCKRGVLSSYYFQLYSNTFILLYAPWSIYCMIKFFDPENDTKVEAHYLYLGMFFLMIEGIVYSVILFLLSLVCILTCFGACLIVRRSRAIERQSVTRIKDMIKRIDLFHFTDRKTDDGHTWFIWSEEIKFEFDMIKLKWDNNHYFHKLCFSEWIMISRACPLWRTWIDEEILKDVQEKSEKSESSINSSSYGSVPVPGLKEERKQNTKNVKTHLKSKEDV